jgi:hypothetical protein
MNDLAIKKASRNTVKIPLTRGKFAMIDLFDALDLSRYKWYADFIGRCWYAVRTEKRRKIYMHRQILGFPACRVDHQDRNTLNNRRNNLRHSTPSQNCANAGKKNYTSEFHGVGWDKSRNKWRAQIKVMYKNHFLGRFDSEIQAAKAYDSAARKYFKEFSNPNFK